MGLIHDPNTRQWKPGDLVIHDSDAKRTDMLMIVLGQDASGVFRTRYAYPWVQARPWRRKIWRNTVEWLPEVLKELLLSQLVALEVVADDQDHTSQLLSRGEVIGCISTSAKAADGFVAECLGAMEYRCYATPEFAASAFPDGLTVPSVLAAPAVLFNRKDSLHDDFLKSRFGFSIDRYAKHFLPSPVALLEGVAMGAGYGLIPSTQAQHFVDSGRLIDLCPNHGVMVDLYWHHWELEPPLAHDVTSLIVNVAHRELVSRTAEESEVVVAGSGDSATRLRPVSPAVASNKAKADCNTH